MLLSNAASLYGPHILYPLLLYTYTHNKHEKEHYTYRHHGFNVNALVLLQQRYVLGGAATLVIEELVCAVTEKIRLLVLSLFGNLHHVRASGLLWIVESVLVNNVASWKQSEMNLLKVCESAVTRETPNGLAKTPYRTQGTWRRHAVFV